MKDVYELFDLIAKNISKIRKEKIKISQEKFAEELDLSRSFISHIESQNIDIGISIDTLFYIAQKYNLDIRDFFDGYEQLMKKDTK